MTIKAFMLGHVRALSRHCKVSIAVNSATHDLKNIDDLHVNLFHIPLEREISPFKDLRALLALFLLFRAEKFDVIHSISPKAGLLSMIAGFMARVPHRIHIFTGQVWVTRKGIGRSLLKMLDRLTAMLATNVLVDSPSQREFLLSEKIVTEEKSESLAQGSVGGVDSRLFSLNLGLRKKIRSEIGATEKSIVFLFLGRLNRDKGVLDLAHAFSTVASDYSEAHLMIVGPDEGGMGSEIERICSTVVQRLHFVSYTDKPEIYISASDVFCLPSYREGFGNVIIEAASVGIPAIGSDIYGIRDAISSGETGLLHKPGDIQDISEKMTLLLKNPNVKKEMGKAAQKRAVNCFSNDALEQSMVDFYREVFGEVL